jgi:hypothetical protein
MQTHPVLLQVVGQVRNHDLGLGGNTVLGRTALLALTGPLRSRLVGALLCGKRFVRSFG